LSLIFSWSLSSSRQKYKENPPGTLRLGDSLFIDRMPILTSNYIEFLKSVNSFYNEALHDSIQKMPLFGITDLDMIKLQQTFHGDSIEYIKMLTRTWMTYSNDEKKYDVDYHLNSSKYSNYPIVNISFEQMKHFCRWRTDMVKLYYATKCKTEKQRRKYPMNFVYRLVQRKEWESTLGVFFYDIKKSKNSSITKRDKPNNVISAYNFEKGRKFYYDVDNAAETLENAVVAFNFNWIKTVGLGDISYFKFDQPSDWVSFRCICEILPEKSK